MEALDGATSDQPFVIPATGTGPGLCIQKSNGFRSS
jgi:hypothetical protein